MKNKVFYFVVIIGLSLIIFSCEKEINSPESESIELMSYKSNGCISIPKFSEIGKITDDAQIEANFINGKLEINIKFTTHCSAEMKDSVNMGEENIDIFLEDINNEGSRCICPQKEEFVFEINKAKEIKIKFCYKAYAQTEYYEMADTTIKIN